MCSNSQAGFDPELYRMILYRDSVENALKYEKGLQEFPEGGAQLYVPSGFKTLDRKTSLELIPKVWKSTVPEGLAFTMYPTNGGPFDSRNERYTICSRKVGHVFDGHFKSEDSTLALPTHGDTTWKAWKIPPTYDPNRHILWYIRSFSIKADSFERFEITFFFLGHSEVIRIQSFNLMYDYQMVTANIPNILEAINFPSGLGYDDYPEAAEPSGLELYDLLGIKSKPATQKMDIWGLMTYIFTGLFIISSVILIQFLRKRKSK